MIKDISGKSLINSDLFVKEPVNIINKKIESSPSKRIILTGGKGCGKSVVLLNKEKNDITKDNKSIYLELDTYCILGRNGGFDDKFFTHYYEMIFADEVLRYIKNNYELTYKRYFKEMHGNLRKIISDTYDYINNCEYIDFPFTGKLQLGDYTLDVINKLKQVLDINNFTLMADRYDSMNEDDQKHFSGYFDMFDQVILSSNDRDLLKDKREKLSDKTYTYIDVDYSTNPDIVKEILERRIIDYNRDVDLKKDKKYPLNILTDEVYSYLANSCNGNIKVMISVIRELALEYWFETDKNFDLNKALKKISYDRINYYQEIFEMDANKPTLHLIKK